MKKFLLAIATAIAATFGMSAQSADITIGYGGYTQMDATNCHDGWHHVNNAWGAVTAGVNFHVLRNFALGPSYTFSSCTTKGGPGHSSIAYHVVMLNGRYSYWHNRIVTLYGHVGVGAIISHMMPKHHDSYNKAYFAYQFTPLGAEVGISRSATLYGELGFGAQGLLQVGFRFRI